MFDPIETDDLQVVLDALNETRVWVHQINSKFGQLESKYATAFRMITDYQDIDVQDDIASMREDIESLEIWVQHIRRIHPGLNATTGEHQ